MSALDKVTLDEETQRKPEPPRPRNEGADELTEWVNSIDLLDLVTADLGYTPVRNGEWLNFKGKCPTCDHNNCFGVRQTESGGWVWLCQSDNTTWPERTGNAFDYIMYSRGLDKAGTAKWVREYTGHPWEPKAAEQPAEVAQGEAVELEQATEEDAPPKFLPKKGEVRNPGPPPPVIIHGLLRYGGLMGVYGASKVGKTWLMIELAIAMATGGKWLGYQCERSRVLFVNPELEESTLLNRVHDVAKAMWADFDEVYEGVDYIHSRGHKLTLEDLERTLDWERKNGRGNYGLVIVDSIYMVGMKNECDSEVVGDFLQELQHIGSDNNCAVVYVHHHSKGGKGDVASLDRVSGSGVFARYPDVIKDITEVHPPDGEEPLPNDATAFAMNTTVRSFAPVPTKNIIWEWPTHRVDTLGLTEDWKARASLGSRRGGQTTGRKQTNENADWLEENATKLAKAIKETDGGVRLTEAASLLGLNHHQTLTNRINAYNEGHNGRNLFEIVKTGPRSTIVTLADTFDQVMAGKQA